MRPQARLTQAMLATSDRPAGATLAQLVERTGYPLQEILALIALARINGRRISCVSVDGVSTFFVDRSYDGQPYGEPVAREPRVGTNEREAAP